MFAAKNLVVFFVVFSTFHIKVLTVGGVLERVGRVTVNTTFFVLA